MIVFDLVCCPGGHRFEGWFGSTADFEAQREGGLLCCPQCGSAEVLKAPMAPSVPRKGNQVQSRSAAPQPVAGGAMSPQAQAALARLATLQTQALQQSRWVGPDFAEQSRAIHYGEREPETIHGQATVDEARALLEEGVAVMPLPFPVAPPDELN